MTYVLIKHKVKDYNRWKAAFDEFIEYRRIGGEQKYQIFHPNGSPNNLILLFRWDNFESAKEFLESKSLRLAMEQAGVTEEPEIQFLEILAEGIV